MFGFEVAAAVLQWQAQRHEEESFLRYLNSLPEDQRADACRVRREAKEKARREAIEERRHRELCDAIRSTRMSGFGLFW